jgi:hypothetical protein
MMSTTAIFVELLIIGAQALMWIVVLAAAFQRSWFPAAFYFKWLPESGTLLTGGVLVTCYSLGIVVDRFADALTHRIRPERLVRRLPWLADQEQRSERAPAFELAFREQRAFEVLNYYRSRFRVARALIPNVLMATLATALFTLTAPSHGSLSRPVLTGVVLILGTSATLAALYTTGALELQMRAWREALVQLLDGSVTTEKGAQNPAAEPDGCAAGEQQPRSAPHQ